MELVNDQPLNLNVRSKNLSSLTHTEGKLFEKSSKRSHLLNSSHDNDSILKNSIKTTEISALEESKSLSSEDDSDAIDVEPTPLEELGGTIVYDNKAQLFGS